MLYEWKKEKISQKSVKREIKTGRKKNQTWTPRWDLNIKGQRNKTIVFNFECFTIQRLNVWDYKTIL